VARVLAVGGVRFVLAGVLAAALAACFVVRAEAAPVFSSSFAAPAEFANSAGSGAQVAVGDRSLTLKWSAVKGAAGYRVSWRGRVLKGGEQTATWSAKWLGLKVLEASDRSFKVSGLVNDREYQLRLESKTTAKNSRWVVSSRLVASPNAVTPEPTPATVPDPPTGVSGVAGDSSAAVSWSAPSSDGGSEITSYTVTAWGDGSQSCTTATLSCTVTGLTNGMSYWFLVKATNARGDSVASLASAAVTPATVPDPPTSVAGLVGHGYVAVSWSAPSSDGGSEITSYTVTASGGGSQSCTTTTLSCTVTGLTNGTAYTFTVKATNALGDSVASVASAAATPRTWNVGDDGPGGGKVFYAPGGTFTETGAACGSSCRYLEAAPAGWDPDGSPDPRLRWGAGNGEQKMSQRQCSYRFIVTRTALGSGFANTAAILDECPRADYDDDRSAPAAYAASTYAPTVNGLVVTGWFLPSIDELVQLDDSAVGGLRRGGFYWSSSQVNAGLARALRKREDPCCAKYWDLSVRPIRAF